MDSDTLGKTAIAVPSDRPAGTSDPCLVVIAGPGMGRTYDLGDTAVEIGRHDECTIAVPSGKVSRRHAAVQRILGKHVVCDLGSTNGTFVNGARVKDGQRLVDGDQIKVGELVLKYIQSKLELQYHQQIQDLVAKDGLTGVQNKRSFDEALAARTNSGGGSLIVFDIDHFKQINDTYGHPIGDYVLKELSTLVSSHLDGSQLFRVGGEEFAILSDQDLPGATALAESLRGRVEQHPFSCDDKRISVTLSLGVTALTSGEVAENAFKRADTCLYQAKRDGRNQVSAG